MREIRPSGSVRGVRRKPHPYRDKISRGFRPVDRDGVIFIYPQNGDFFSKIGGKWPRSDCAAERAAKGPERFFVGLIGTQEHKKYTLLC